jgi:hypothetical protein
LSSATSSASQPIGHATPTPNYRLVDTRIAGTPDVNRDTQANCPTIAMNTGEFGPANQSDHYVF